MKIQLSFVLAFSVGFILTTLQSQAQQLEEGLSLLQKNCYTCHNPKSKSHEEIIAPPLSGIKTHYLKEFPQKSDFTNAMFGFVTNPAEEQALMKGPIKRFGLMPKPNITESELKKIIDYIYSEVLENPQWHIEKDNGQHP